MTKTLCPAGYKIITGTEYRYIGHRTTFPGEIDIGVKYSWQQLEVKSSFAFAPISRGGEPVILYFSM